MIHQSHFRLGIHTTHDVHVSMPGYVETALKCIKHKKPTKPQQQPHPHVPLNCGAKVQHVNPEDTSSPLNKSGKKFIQEVMGTFIFYA